MRKLGVSLAVVAALFCFFAAQAMAEEKTVEQRVKALEDSIGAWNFYGSIRFDTFYENASKNFDDTFGDFDFTDNADRVTKWGMPVNSRIGANVNRGEFGGKIEIGLVPDSGTTIRTRLAYATYTVNDFTLLIGQDYPPLGDWANSNQIFASDNDLCDFGIMDEARVPQIKVKWKGLQVAFVDPRDTRDDTGFNAPDDASTEVLFPHLEVKYSVATDKFFYDVFGGYNTYKVKSDVVDDARIHAYAYGVNGGVTMNAFYANAMVYGARNGKELGLIQATGYSATGTDEGGQIGAYIDDDGDVTNSEDFGFAAVVGMNIQKITVEAGYGYVSSKNDDLGDIADRARSMYLQAVIPIASGNGAKFFMVPEVGIFDYMKNVDGESQGSASYVGTRWQINF